MKAYEKEKEFCKSISLDDLKKIILEGEGEEEGDEEGQTKETPIKIVVQSYSLSPATAIATTTTTTQAPALAENDESEHDSFFDGKLDGLYKEIYKMKVEIQRMKERMCANQRQIIRKMNENQTEILIRLLDLQYALLSKAGTVSRRDMNDKLFATSDEDK